MEKIFTKRKYSYLIIALLSIILVEGSFKELLHNHPLDINRHDNCPVLVLTNDFNSAITISFELKPILLAEYTLIIPDINPPARSDSNNSNPRAPPII